MFNFLKQNLKKKIEMPFFLYVISVHCCIAIHSENIRKPLGFWMFSVGSAMHHWAETDRKLY